jgi:hypothetical protein
MDLVSGFCSIGDGVEEGGFSGMSSECTAEGLHQGCRSGPKGDEDDSVGVGHVRAAGEVGDEYIVRFKEYRHAAEFKRALEERLAGSGRVWQWLERNNPASAFPTDFALLRIKGTGYEDMVGALRRLEFVKDVSPQMRFTRALMSESSENERRSGTGEEESNGKYEGFDAEGEEEMPEIKPPGRLRTKLSYEDEFQDATPPLLANVSLDHGRKLLLQVTTGSILG